MKQVNLAIIGTAALACGSIQAGLVAYYPFDSYTLGSNPSWAPQSGTTGTFADLSGNGNDLYGGELASGTTYAPYDATGGKWGGAFHSISPNKNPSTEPPPARSLSHPPAVRSRPARKAITCQSFR